MNYQTSHMSTFLVCTIITIYMFTLIKRLQEKVSKICDSKGQRAYKIAKVMVLVPFEIVSQNQNN